MLAHASSATQRIWSVARSSEPDALARRCCRAAQTAARRSIHTPRATLAGASLAAKTSPSPVVVFARHRSKHYREPESLHAYEYEREQVEQEDQDPVRVKRIEDTARAYFRNTFAPLAFPAEVAMRMLTHASYRGGQYGHNTRLSFVGRRVLHAYLRLFVLSAVIPDATTSATEALRNPFALPFDDVDDFCDDLLNTYKLGEFVGGAWQIEHVMRWTPAIVEPGEAGALLRSSGLFKVRGTAVEAVMGGIFHQHGGTVALRAFHTRVLPHLDRFLKEPLRSHAREKRDAMGGESGSLLSVPQGQRTGADGTIFTGVAYQPPPLRRRSEKLLSHAPPPYEARQKLRAAGGQ
ncbi:hypothetical protein EXIGLDRAFT_831554 [Exidia glandulosa HHB12029]|uniref:RNase III domain-containing protein n=1 Tax=Exidia glandulosa HHB12029 TaxID=1314781 RepID=A0A165MFP8_EXIGL|nr:hypothetical protein EXIGLDRAFT_831554 [Exidia glandulosa HHB12029]